jgi:hypothetical protein
MFYITRFFFNEHQKVKYMKFVGFPLVQQPVQPTWIYPHMGRRRGRGLPSQHITSGWRESSAGRSTYLDISTYKE